MATPQKKVTFMNNNDSAILMAHEEEYKEEEEEAQIDDSTSGCGCFKLFCFEWHRNSDNERKHLLHQKGENRESWWVKKMKKVKEVSEVVAGPKWKNFLRKIGGYCNNNNKKRQRKQQFQYDPQSYALNFDNGGAEEEDDFSSRFSVGAPFLDEQRRNTGRDYDGL